MSLKHSLNALQSLLASQLPCPVIPGRPEQSLGLYLFPWHIHQATPLQNTQSNDTTGRPCTMRVVLLPKADCITSLDLLDQARTIIEANPMQTSAQGTVQTSAQGTVQIMLDAWSAETMLQFFTAAALPLQSALACELRTHSIQ